MNLVLNDDHVGEAVTEESIARYLSSFIEGDADSIFILSSEQGFVQAAKREDGSFVLEHCDRSVDEHWVCSADNLSREQLSFAFKSYFLADKSWVKRFSWEKMDLEVSDDAPQLSELKQWHMGVVLVVVLVFLIWSLIKTFA